MPARVLALLAAAAAGVLGGGCGTEELRPEGVAEAARATAGERSAATTVRIRVTGFGLPEPATVAGDGAMALDRALWDLTFDLGSVLEQFGVGVGAGDAGMRVVWRDEVIDVRIPELPDARLPGGARWVRVDLAGLAGRDADGLAALLALDLSVWIDALRRTRGVKEIGEEDVAGVATTRYVGEVTQQDYIDALPRERRAAATRALEALGSSPEEATGIDVWIDGDDRIRRLEQRVNMPADAGTPAGNVVLTYSFREFGAPVDPRPPADDEVYDATREVAEAIAG